MIVALILDLCIGYTIAHAAINLIARKSFAARVTHLKTEYLKRENQNGGGTKMQNNKDKKDYLFGYQNTVKKLVRLEDELNEIESLMHGVRSIKTPEIPKGSEQSDLSNLFARLSEIQNNLEIERKKQIGLYISIKSSIDSLEDEDEKNILFFRYIKRLSWWDVADKTGFSERQVYRIHGEALKHLKIS